MARGKDQVEWRRAKESVEFLRAAWVEKPFLPPGVMDPYYVPRVVSQEEKTQRMEMFLGGLDKLYGSK